MKKLTILLFSILSLGLIGCSGESEEGRDKHQEKEKIEYEMLQTHKVEGVCFENHTTVKNIYEGSITFKRNTVDNVIYLTGDVMLKDMSIGLGLGKIDSEDFNEFLYGYTPPLDIVFLLTDIQKQGVIFTSEVNFIPLELKLHGISNLYTDSDSNDKSYLSTCLLDVLELEKIHK